MAGRMSSPCVTRTAHHTATLKAGMALTAHFTLGAHLPPHQTLQNGHPSPAELGEAVGLCLGSMAAWLEEAFL